MPDADGTTDEQGPVEETVAAPTTEDARVEQSPEEGDSGAEPDATPADSDSSA
ncbi:cytochrome Cy, partial [Rathayibacter sp. AY1E1]